MASLKFRHYATESALIGSSTLQVALNAMDVGDIVFIDDTQKQYIITSKNNNVVTYSTYYGKAAITGVTGTGATRTLTFSDGSEITITIDNVEHAIISESCSGNANSATTLQNTRKINGTNFNGSADITTNNWGTSRNIGIVNSDGSGTAIPVSINGSNNINLKLPSTIKANLEGNASTAGTATTAGNANTIGGISISKLVYGSNSTKTTNITEDQLNAPLASGFYTISNTTTGSSATIPNATSVSMILHTSYSGPNNNAGFDLLINDSTTSSLHFRPATGSGKGAWKTLIDTGNIGLQSVNYAASSGACTGNAATATKLQTARKIWGQNFDGTGNVSGELTGVSGITFTSSGTTYGSYGNPKLGANAADWTVYSKDTVALLVVRNYGNVGIGTTSPTSKLHVVGTGYFTSDVSSASNIIAGSYIKGETVKISSGCTLQYDSAQKCVKFVF